MNSGRKSLPLKCNAPQRWLDAVHRHTCSRASERYNAQRMARTKLRQPQKVFRACVTRLMHIRRWRNVCFRRFHLWHFSFSLSHFHLAWHYFLHSNRHRCWLAGRLLCCISFLPFPLWYIIQQHFGHGPWPTMPSVNRERNMFSIIFIFFLFHFFSASGTACVSSLARCTRSVDTMVFHHK